MRFQFFATAPKGMETLLAQELTALGATAVRATRAGVAFEGSLELGYRACLWSRIASRILLMLARFPASSPEELYAGVRLTRWDEHLAPEGTLAVSFSSVQSTITHTRFGALKVKDAIVDQFREAFGRRPSIEVRRPDVRVNVYLYRDEAYLSLDLSGESLHRRGYREEAVIAPLKENLAAAILLYARWPELAASGAPLLDPMCGSGTLPIEAALIAADIAPGLLRPYYGFMGWRGHDSLIWAHLMEEAHARKQLGYTHLPTIVGYDIDRDTVRVALANLERAGLGGLVHIGQRELAAARPVGHRPGLLVANPPYGERLDQAGGLSRLYAELGHVLKRHFKGWQVGIFTGNPQLVHRLRICPQHTYALYNGALRCKLLLFEVSQQQTPRQSAKNLSILKV